MLLYCCCVVVVAKERWGRFRTLRCVVARCPSRNFNKTNEQKYMLESEQRASNVVCNLRS
jgi:hypothetical protein